jgi:1-deoxy-D-xylulose-5-phosphate reductoisomerase
VENVAVADGNALAFGRPLFPNGTKFFVGEGGLGELAKLPDADAAIVAMTGTAGIWPTMAAMESGKNVLLASKEVLVVGGKFVMECAKAHNVSILPIDSEHNAIFQCLGSNGVESVAEVILTASGGPFRNFSKQELENVTVEQTLRHPIWSMGRKITVDSATMANKALEIMEARWLFGVPGEKITAIIHPESIIHSMVRFCDGSTMAQMCPPNMEFPIGNCLFFPDKERFTGANIDFVTQKSLTFFPIDCEKFPMVALGKECLGSGPNACAAFHGANEVAVEKFLRMEIKFPHIHRIVADTLDSYRGEPTESIESSLETVERAREIAEVMARK